MDNHLSTKHLCKECKEYFFSLDEHIERKHTLSPTYSNMNKNKWATIKCDLHKGDHVSNEVLRNCPSCRKFPVSSSYSSLMALEDLEDEVSE